MSELGYYLIVAFSAFSLGAAGFAAILDALMGRSWKSPKPWRAIMKLGYMVVVGVILWLVLPRRIVDPSPALYAYLVGLSLAGIGATGTAMTTIKSYVRFTEDDEEARR